MDKKMKAELEKTELFALMMSMTRLRASDF